MASVHPVRQQFPVKKPRFISFYALINVYKGQEVVSDYPDLNPVYPVILSKNSPFISCLPIQNDEEPYFIPLSIYVEHVTKHIFSI